MGPQAKWEYFKRIHARYRKASKLEKKQILDEFTRVCGYHRKHAIRKLNGPLSDAPRQQAHPPRRRVTYGAQLIGVLRAVWEVAGYPWSVRLKALLPVWLPWIQQRYRLSAAQTAQLLQISARQIDRRLAPFKRTLRTRLYGRTKPGTLLKHQIPLRTDNWDITTPGFLETDLVSHSGNSADGDFIYSLNLTDIQSTWSESAALLGKGQTGVVRELDRIATDLPFVVRGIDADNGSEFINHHLTAYCRLRHIQFTRGRPYKKDDNAHIEQKNWTHVRKLLGWERYDSAAAVRSMQTLYRGDLRLMMNLFQPSVKLVQKVRIGSRLIRRYDRPQTPLDRLVASGAGDSPRVQALLALRRQLDPFTLAQSIERQLEHIWSLANDRRSPHAAPSPVRARRQARTNGRRPARATANRKPAR